MMMSFRSFLSHVAAGLFGVCLITGLAFGSGKPHYLVANNDVPPQLISSVTFYTVGANGLLTVKEKVSIGQGGIGGGYFGLDRLSVLSSGNTNCIFASQPLNGEIVGISVDTLQSVGHTNGSEQDTGSSNGVGLAMNGKYLYASFTDPNTIGTFQVKPDCSLTFISDINVGGLRAGVIDGMAIHGNIMITTYGDGSIESFDISAGVPVSNGDEQISSASGSGATYPNGIVITKDGHYAIFGDTASSTVIEVSDISSGKLTPTVVYRLGPTRSSSNILLSPDETLLYISDTQGDRITAAFFDASTGKVSKGCISGALKGYVSGWSYLGSLALQTTTGTGGVIYAAEFGAPSSIAEIAVTSAGGKCTLEESAGSPVSDPYSPGLLSIETFPPL
jgi:sugar lactone lactonase YvrE